MKKLINILLLLSLSLPFSSSLMGQSGSGTSGDPYYGTIDETVEWDPSDYTNDEIYIGTSSNNDLSIITGGHLTILEGAKLIFTQTTSNLIITGTGRITADATSGNEILFTKATGEANWGHISFESMTTTNPENYPSIFNYCTIEYGKSDYGGGIQISFTYITITNSTFQHNTAARGGGIMVNTSSTGYSPSISNCYIYDNEATFLGGGIFIWDKSSATVNNCLIESNRCTNTSSYGGGGILIYTSIGTSKITNSTFVNNSSSNEGNDIYIHNINNCSFINCIAWGLGSSVYIDYDGSNLKDYYLINSAIEEVYGPSGNIDISNFQNSIILNTSNSEPDGPNFEDIIGPVYNWAIEFKSPCRDSGTDTGAPTTDFDGNSRIGTTDIGAYEIQYSRWTGASGTDWTTSGNWLYGITPFAGGGVAIPGSLTNYPDVSGTLTISSGDQLVLEPGGQATFGTLSNSGTLKIESDATGVSSLKVGTYTDSGSEEIELFLTGGGAPNHEWHYVSPPLSSAPKTVFTESTQSVLHYIESDALTDENEGWAWHDGENINGVSGAAFGTDFSPGVGYNVYYKSDTTFTFSGGGLNTGISSLPTSGSLSFSDHGADISGYNLIGNPFTCYIDWQAVTDDASFPANTSSAIFYNIDIGWATYNNGVSARNGSRYIPPMQGVFTKTYSTGNNFPIPSSALVHNTQSYFKNDEVISLIRIELSDELTSDEMVIRFDNKAQEGFDYKYDALKLFRNTSSLLLWAKADNREYVINGTPFPQEDTEYNIEINIPDAGSFKLTTSELNGLEDYKQIYLVDTYQGNFSVNLNDEKTYTFSSDEGTFTDRFKISFLATGLDDILVPDNLFNIYTYGDQINIQTISDEWGSLLAEVNIYDLTGRVISKHTNVELYNGETISLPFMQANGIYLVEIRDSKRRVIQKVSHR